jgi:aryl-alcohol dehydrogenase-like predicted oxidoreductase
MTTELASLPQLGLGTASVLGGVGRRKSQHAILQAYKLGVRHFDTARSYGWGEAEGLLGRTLKPFPRESYTLVSKCGLLPTKRSRALSLAKSVARLVARSSPLARRLVRSVASTQAFQPTATYDVRALEQSFETTLAELDTRYLDVLLLHNFETGKAGLPEVVAFLRELQQRGRIRRFGFSVEGDLHAGLRFLADHAALADAVIQVPFSSALLSLPDEWRGVSYIAHSPLRYLSKQARAISSANLSAVFDEVARACRCEAIVCSMFSPAHLQDNVAALGLRARPREA